MPRVSIITSIFNSSSFLVEFLNDVKRQSIFQESEVLLLDCNKGEKDFKLIEPYLYLPQLKYHKLPECTVYQAWNEGIRLAKSDIITNWNTDDRRKYNSLETQVEFLEENQDIDVCYGPTLISKKANEKFEDCRAFQVWPALEGTIENQLLHNSPHCLPVWRKSVHDRFGTFDESYTFAADYDMWFRVLQGGGKLAPLSDPVGLYFQNPDGVSTREATLSKAFQEVLEIREKYS
jgi:glycosyltransferase involved in cell wall biosynthesis